jgi:AraC-like DNA-binding protein
MQFSTDLVRPSQRAQFWRDICNGIIELDCRIDTDEFAGSLEFTALGNSPAFLIRMGSCFVERSAMHVERTVDPPILLIYEAAGRIRYESVSSDFTYGCGQFVLIDTAIPYRAHIGPHCNEVLIAVDRRALTLRLGDYRRYLGVPVSSENPLGAMACAMLATVQRSISSLDPAASAALESHVLDIVALALARESGAAAPGLPPAESALVRLNAAVDAAVIDARLAPEEVAARAEMSMLEANLLLRRDRITLPDLLRGKRLDRSRDRLAVAHRNPAAVSGIAADAGYADAAAFRRAFRDRFGEDPV